MVHHAHKFLLFGFDVLCNCCTNATIYLMIMNGFQFSFLTIYSLTLGQWLTSGTSVFSYCHILIWLLMPSLAFADCDSLSADTLTCERSQPSLPFSKETKVLEGVCKWHTLSGDLGGDLRLLSLSHTLITAQSLLCCVRQHEAECHEMF